MPFKPRLWTAGPVKQRQEDAPGPGEACGRARWASLAAPFPPSIGHPWSCRVQARRLGDSPWGMIIAVGAGISGTLERREVPWLINW